MCWLNAGRRVCQPRPEDLSRHHDITGHIPFQVASCLISSTPTIPFRHGSSSVLETLSGIKWASQSPTVQKVKGPFLQYIERMVFATYLINWWISRNGDYIGKLKMLWVPLWTFEKTVLEKTFSYYIFYFGIAKAVCICFLQHFCKISMVNNMV